MSMIPKILKCPNKIHSSRSSQSTQWRGQWFISYTADISEKLHFVLIFKSNSQVFKLFNYYNSYFSTHDWYFDQMLQNSKIFKIEVLFIFWMGLNETKSFFSEKNLVVVSQFTFSIKEVFELKLHWISIEKHRAKWSIVNLWRRHHY